MVRRAEGDQGVSASALSCIAKQRNICEKVVSRNRLVGESIAVSSLPHQRRDKKPIALIASRLARGRTTIKFAVGLGVWQWAFSKHIMPVLECKDCFAKLSSGLRGQKQCRQHPPVFRDGRTSAQVQ